VISRYGYTPEFSSLKKQVGAVIASLALSHNAVKKSRARIASKLTCVHLDAGYAATPRIRHDGR
jgi:hypothetical protein